MADHPNVERLRKGYDAFSSGNLDALRDLFAEDIAWHVAGNTPISGDYKGIDEVFGFFGRLVEETGGTFRIEVHDILANDEHGVTLARATAERKGKRLDANFAHVFHINSEGKTTEFWGMVEDSDPINEFWS